MYVITYSLRENYNQSDAFYQELSDFSDEVLAEIAALTQTAVEDYASYRIQKDSSKLHSREEYGFELLILGTLWEIYSGDASQLGEVPQQMLEGLTTLRKQGGTLKPGIDFIRGILSTVFLSPDLYDHMFKLDVSIIHLVKLLDWLAATGEFNQEVIRLRKWEEYLNTLPLKAAVDILATAITLAVWFKDKSEEALGKYTGNVDRYLNEMRPEHYWREDIIFCGRRRTEYHLNMVGAEIMNRAFRERFINAPEKAVLIPVCMRLLTADECKGHTDDSGFHCAGCTSECNVFKLTKLGREKGFSVQVVSHESSISANRENPTFINSETGVVGVACVLNLISGGWLLDDMNVPAQCVFLDYCGCKNHWSREGIPTEINVEQLIQVLGIVPEFDQI